MSWRILGEADTGDATHYGGFDIAKISRLFRATANVDVVDYDSNIFHRDTRFKLKNGNFAATFRTTNIASNYDLFAPVPTGVTSDTLLSGTNSIAVANKIIPAWDNNLAGVSLHPGVKKEGAITCGGVIGGGSIGLMDGYVNEPANPTRVQDNTFGAAWRYASGSSANTLTGIRVPARFSRKEWGLYFRCKTRVNTVSNSRQFVGFSWNPTLPASDTPLANAESGILIGWRSSDTNVQVITNAGTAGTPTTPTPTSTSVTKSSMGGQVRQFEISFTSATNASVRIMDGNATTALYTNNFTSNLPNDFLAPMVCYSDTTSTSTNYDIFFVEMQQTV